MRVVRNDKLICYDVDDTLVTFNFTDADLPKTVLVGKPGFEQRVLPFEAHVQAIKNSKTRGHYVVVWSQGGHEWAEAVVKALELEEYVDLIMCKPAWIYDDLDASAWMPKRFYYGLRESDEDK